MSSVALESNAARSRAINPWIVAVAVVIPTFMEILDTTIATSSLRYIAGGLSASMDDSDWVMTSYLAANATIRQSPAGSRPTWVAAGTSSSASPSSPSPR